MADEKGDIVDRTAVIRTATCIAQKGRGLFSKYTTEFRDDGGSKWCIELDELLRVGDTMTYVTCIDSNSHYAVRRVKAL